MDKEKKRGFVSLSSKIIRGISIPVVLIFLAAGFLILGTAKMQIDVLKETELIDKSQSASYQVSEFFTRYLTHAQQIASNRDFEDIVRKSESGARMNELPEYDSVYKGLIKAASVDTENILSTWIGGFEISQIIQSDGYISDVGWDITQRPWYQVKSSKDIYLTPPYIDASTGQMIITAAAPILDENTGEAIGAAGIDIALTQIYTIMQTYTLGKTGSFLLSDSDGTVIFYPDSDLINKNVKEIGLSDNILDAILNNRKEVIEYDFNGVKAFGYISMVGTTNWNVISMLPSREFHETINQLMAAVIAIFALGIVVIILIVRLIAGGMIKPLKKLTNAAERIAEGDLEVDVAAENNDEIGALGAAIHDTVIRLKDYIIYIDETAEVLGKIAEGDIRFELKQEYVGEFAVLKTGLLQIQEKLTGTLTHINEVAGQVAEGAQQIAQVAATIASSSTDQSASVEELDKSIKYVNNLSEENYNNAELANKSAQSASSFMEEGNRKMEELTNKIAEISETSQKINGIMEIIEDISSQTNLLSLNASIEAARAGEAGRGFAVVAGEVGSLANQTAGSSKETGVLITAILESIKQGMDFAVETTKAMQEVLENAKDVSVRMEGISASVRKEAEAIGELNKEAEHITAAVESNMAISEESVAASEELSSQAQALRKLVGEFKI